MPIPALLSRDTTMTASLLFCYALSSHCPFIPPNAIQCHLSSLFSLCLSLLCVLSSVTNLAQLQQRSQRLSKLGFGRACEKDGCRGENIGFQYVGGAASAAGSRAVVRLWMPRQFSCLGSSGERQGGGAGGGSALMGSNLQWQIASMQLWTSRRSQPQNTHTNAHTHTSTQCLINRPTHPAHSPATASCPDSLSQNSGRLHSLPKQRRGQTDEKHKRPREKVFTLKVLFAQFEAVNFDACFQILFFLHFPGRKPFLVGTNASSNLCFVSNLSALLLCVDRGLLLHSVLCFCSVAPWSFPKG